MTSPPALLLGADRPRSELRPALAAYSLGAEAVELAERAGLPLEDWQAEGLELMLSVREDGRWAAREYAEIVGRQQGKSAGLGVPRALAGLLLLGERLIMWSAHEVKTALEAFLQVRDALVALGEETGPNTIVVDGITISVNNTNGKEGFRLSTGQRLKFLARSKGSGRGLSGDCNLIDEAFAYTRSQQSALAPTLLARPNPQTVYLSSPPLDSRTGAVLFALKARAEAGEPGLGWRDWGLAKLLDELLRMKPDERTAFLDDRRNWAATLPALGRGRVTEEGVEQLRRELDDEGFGREVLCMWPPPPNAADGWRVIPKDVWGARGGAIGRPGGPVAFALGAQWPDAAMGAIGVVGRAGDELVAQVVSHRPGTGWMVPRLLELRDRHEPVAVVLDKKGPAGHLLTELEEAGVDVVTPTLEEIAQGFGRFCAEVSGDDPSLRHYDQPELDAALAGASTRPLGRASTWAQKGDVDISPIEVVTLALHGLVAHEARGYEPWAEWG